jgi:hypothetical protein
MELLHLFLSNQYSAPVSVLAETLVIEDDGYIGIHGPALIQE